MWQALCSLLLCVTVSQLRAQNLQNAFLPAKSKPTFIYGLDNRSSHLYGQSASIFGVYAGIGLRERKLRCKIGFNLSQPFSWKLGQADSTRLTGFLVFANIGEEMEVLRHRRAAINSYFNAGLGYLMKTRGPNLAPTLASYQRKVIAPIEVGLVFGYDVTQYLTFKAGGGWRFVFPELNQNLSGLFLKLSAQFRWSDWKTRKD
jgi:hypothetical protein